MNVVDVAVALLVATAVVYGAMVGASVLGLSFAGLWAGLTAGAAVAPALAGLVTDPVLKAILTLVAVFGGAAVAAGIGQGLGVWLWKRIGRVGLGWADAGFGATLSGVATLLTCWLLAAMVAASPLIPLGAQIQRSAILSTLDHRLPPAPAVFARIQRLLEARGFPRVFAEFEPDPAPAPPPPGPAEVEAAVAAGAASAVRIIGTGCGGIQTGSGFVAAAGLVVTNAHVVAGIARPVVLHGAGRHPATPVLFDPGLDIAVLETPGLRAPPLPWRMGFVPTGSRGAVLGYPGGGPFRAEPAVVSAQYRAVGRDIYGRGLVARTVYELNARVRSGNSGGPLVLTDGTVAGVVFSRSARAANVGYALTSPQVAARVQTVQRGAAVSTGPCAA